MKTSEIWSWTKAFRTIGRRHRARRINWGRRRTWDSLERRDLLSAAPGLDVAPNLGSDIRDIEWHGSTVQAKAGEWIVKFNDIHGPAAGQLEIAQSLINSTLPARIASSVHLDRRLAANGLFLATTAADASAQDFVSQLQTVPHFAYAEPNFATGTLDRSPNDAKYGSQWNLKKINAPAAWDITTGSRNVVIGVIDSGIDYTHPDLAANIWLNPGEIPDDNIDNDGNGYIDDIHGWNFVDHNNDTLDRDGHGTAVSGIIGAVGNDSLGVTGIAWDVQLMALVWDSNNRALTSAAVEAVNYATMMRRDYGINVRATSNSYEVGQYSQSLYDAIKASRDADILFVNSAGNYGQNLDTIPRYPKNFDLDNILVVGATDAADQLSAYSNYGVKTVDLFAPSISNWGSGPGITTTSAPSGLTGSETRYLDDFGGTSAACPHVAGVAALAFSLAPTANYQQVKDAIMAGVDKIHGLQSKSVAGGRLNALGALQHLGLFVKETDPADQQILASRPQNFSVDFTQAIDPTTVDASDLTVNGIDADSVERVGGDSLRFHFNVSPIVQEGPQEMRLKAGAILRLGDGNPLTSISRTFYYDASQLSVVTSTPVAGTVVPITLGAIELTFNEPVDPLSIDIHDLTLSQGIVTGAQILGGNMVRYQIGNLISDGPLHVNIGPNKIRNSFGNPMPPYAAEYQVDRGTTAISDWQLLPPFGNLAYSKEIQGTINAADDQDTFTVILTAGQTLRARVSGRADLRAHVEVRDPNGKLLAGSSAPVDTAADTGLVVAGMAGTYTIVVSGMESSVGPYQVDLFLDADLDSDRNGGPANDSLANAQDIEQDFVTIIGGARRAVISGRSDWPVGILPQENEPNNVAPSANDASKNFQRLTKADRYQSDVSGEVSAAGDTDWYRIGFLPFASSLTIHLAGTASGRGTLDQGRVELYRSNKGQPILVANGETSSPSGEVFLDHVPANIPDTYFLSVRGISGQIGTYHVGLWLETTAGSVAASANDVIAEAEGNDALDTANSLSFRRAVYLANTEGTINTSDVDVFKYALNAADGLSVFLESHGTADPHLVLRDAQGHVLASDDESGVGSGKSAALIGVTIPSTGGYVLEVSSGSAHGAYSLNVYLSRPTAPETQTAAASSDVYAMRLHERENISLGLAGSLETAGHIELVDGTNTVVATGNLTRNYSSAITNFSVPRDGTYYAVVHDTPGTDYRLAVLRDAVMDAEGNDTIASATPLNSTQIATGFVNRGAQVIKADAVASQQGWVPAGPIASIVRNSNDWSGSFLPTSKHTYQATLAGSIGRSFQGHGDTDFFRLIAAPGDQLTVSMSMGDSPAWVELMDHDGRFLTSGRTSGSFTFRDFPYLGDYYLWATSDGWNATGSYNLTGRLTTLQPLGTSDDDFYGVLLEAGKTVLVRASTPTIARVDSSLPVEPLSVALEIRDGQGTVVVPDSLSDSGEGEARVLFTAPADGIYSIRVYANSGGGEYVLQVTTQGDVNADIDGDHEVTAADLDLFAAQIAAGGFQTRLDFVPDGTLDRQDVDFVLAHVLHTTRGDLDLDGDVDSADLAQLLAGWTGVQDPQTGRGSWSAGDMDGDGDTDSADLLALLGQWTGAAATSRRLFQGLVD